MQSLFGSEWRVCGEQNTERDITSIFAGGHDASVLAVTGRRSDAGFAFGTLVERQLIEQHQIQPDKIVSVWISNQFPRGR
ncbi:MAG: PhnD/SsuA/transferrin family substrate-binding protein [Pseudonocardiaceae bacterium]